MKTMTSAEFVKRGIKVKKPRRHYRENEIRIAVAEYVALTYPEFKLYLHFDLTGCRLAKAQAGIAAACNEKGWPDLQLAVARRGCHGLYIEIKVEGWWLKSTDQCGQRQFDMLRKLRWEGYWTGFAAGTKETCDAIDWYLAEEPKCT